MQRTFQSLIAEAKKAASNAYAPYSKFNVGACVLFESGNIVTGCNVENASYGLALCAERNALSTAIAQGEKSKPIAVAIYSPNMEVCMPCGACRQWIAELSDNECEIILEDKKGQIKSFRIKDLLPYAFKL